MYIIVLTLITITARTERNPVNTNANFFFLICKLLLNKSNGNDVDELYGRLMQMNVLMLIYINITDFIMRSHETGTLTVELWF